MHRAVPTLIPFDIEESPQLAEETVSSSPVAQSFHEFIAYSRIALPMPVEANLQAIVNAEMAPSEDRLKILVVDIIRRCQSTVAQNFEQLKKPMSKLPDSKLLSAGADAPDGPREEETSPTRSLTREGVARGALLHYQELPFFDPFAGLDVDQTPQAGLLDIPAVPVSDSRYRSSDSGCLCSCHLGIDSSNSANGMKLFTISRAMPANAKLKSRMIVISVQ